MTLTVGALFEGIGGMSLGLERAGMITRWMVEYDPFCRQILEQHWPEVPKYGDIKEIDFHELEPVDLLCGGFPCQPVSVAGKGLAQEDPRWLWPEFARAIREMGPRWVLVENVPGLMRKGFGDVATDLAALGYDFEWDRIPAAAFGAPHLRFRVIIVAHANGKGLREQPISERRSGRSTVSQQYGEIRDVANTDSIRRIGWPRVLGARGGTESSGRVLLSERAGEFVVRSRGVGGGSSSHWIAEPDVGRVANGVPNRVDRLKCLGNAVVPQQIEWVGRRIIAVEEAASR